VRLLLTRGRDELKECALGEMESKKEEGYQCVGAGEINVRENGPGEAYRLPKLCLARGVGLGKAHSFGLAEHTRGKSAIEGRGDRQRDSQGLSHGN